MTSLELNALSVLDPLVLERFLAVGERVVWVHVELGACEGDAQNCCVCSVVSLSKMLWCS